MLRFHIIFVTNMFVPPRLAVLVKSHRFGDKDCLLMYQGKYMVHKVVRSIYK